MTQLFKDFFINLRSGLQLALFRPCTLSDFRFGIDQLAALLFANLSLEILSDLMLVLPQAEFNLYALPTYSFKLSCFFLAVYAIGKLFRRDVAMMQIGVIVFSFSPLTLCLQFLLLYLYARWPEIIFWLYRLYLAYVFTVFCRSLYLVSQRLKRMTVSALILMTIPLSVSQVIYGEYSKFWFAEADQDISGVADPYAEYRALDAEALMYRQPAILEQALLKIRPQQKKSTDVFFVGFAGYATEDVFLKEVDYVRQMLDERFDTKGHSINLINHLSTLDHTPLATSTNLALTLKRIGTIMNREDDMLLLYLTSHGSKQELMVSFWPLKLNAITPEKLKAMLDDAGIKWRVIIISACYSGSFVQALQGPTTLVATAAAADKTSFGCGTESEFTYFGEAVFKEQLNRHSSFITALEQATISIGRRETREKLEASMPQLSIGTAIAAKLEQLDKKMQQYQCGLARKLAAKC